VSRSPRTLLTARHRTLVLVLTVAAAAGVAACAPATLRLPEGPWTPAGDSASAVAQATSACAGARTFTAELAVSGRAAGSRLRGRLVAGFERPGRVRLEGVAPFGAPAFVLASRGERAVLWLPRERRAVEGEPVAAVLEALTGLRRSADDLLGLLTGCLVAAPGAQGVAQNPAGWLSVDFGDGVTAFLRQQDGAWRLVAGRSKAAGAPEWAVEYGEFLSRFPGVIRLRERAAGAPGAEASTDLTLRVSQREVNVTLPPAAFDVILPPGTSPMTLDELRGRGPLAEPAASPRRRP
jgi:hypothetical protein